MSASSEGPQRGAEKATSKGRRIAEKTARSPRSPRAARAARAPRPSRERKPAGVVASETDRRVPQRRVAAVVVGVLVAGLLALGCAVADLGPHWIDGAGAIAVSTALTAALTHRTGGRPELTTLLALAIGLAAVVVDEPVLKTGAAVLTVVVGGVYAVMATVPAVSFLRAAREVLIATFVSGFAAVAAVGFEPTIVGERFDYASLLLALGLVFVLVYRLGAGIHGLGRRGAIVVLAGVGVLVLTLAYGELFRRYGAGSVMGSVIDFVAWTKDHIGAFPRPLVVFMGIPALLWGCFQRARRRQGWWVCAFGVTATIPLAQGLLEPGGSFLEAGLRGIYSLIGGLLLGYLLVRLDLALTAPRGRRGRRAEEADAHRPEPSRFAEL